MTPKFYPLATLTMSVRFFLFFFSSTIDLWRPVPCCCAAALQPKFRAVTVAGCSPPLVWICVTLDPDAPHEGKEWKGRDRRFACSLCSCVIHVFK